MGHYQPQSLLYTSVNKLAFHLKEYSISNLDTLPSELKHLIVEKLSRRTNTTLPPGHLSALLHHRVRSLNVSFLAKVNVQHIQALHRVPELNHLTASRLNIESCSCIDTYRITSCEGCNNISRHVRTALESFTLLVTLDLSHNKTIVNDQIVLTVTQNSPHLEQLELKNCAKVTDFCFAHGANLYCIDSSRQCEKSKFLAGLVLLSRLKSLGLSGTSVSDFGLIAFSHHSKSCHVIEELLLNGCKNITDDGIEKILDNCNSLNILSFSKCENVSMTSVTKLSDYFQKRMDSSHRNQSKHVKQISYTIW